VEKNRGAVGTGNIDHGEPGVIVGGSPCHLFARVAVAGLPSGSRLASERPTVLIHALEIAAIVAAGLVTIPAVAHVLELPGKMRLDEAEYRNVQRIYYPGFTIVGGAAEVVAPLLSLVLLILRRPGTPHFWLTLLALAALLAVQLVFWLMTQPINRIWVRGMAMGTAGTRLFTGHRIEHGGDKAWTSLRNRWEVSHVLRAALAAIALVALSIAA
jgi:hypothetical protein